ncbi:Triadin [Merluccius polli]|uniref:Triadin n=1 Tax=Merluccius polli TaxID=89951 RepID=A0AA47P327_MERPO|nr:Triadin [Merluccius polli]
MAGIVGSIGSYDENVEQWSSYTERFECFVIANKIEDETLVPTFLTVMGPKTYNLLRCLVQPDKPGAKSYEAIVATLATHFSPKPLVIAERLRFHKRNQEEGESVAVFVAALRRLAEHCEFGAVLNDTIRDRLVCGMRCEAAQKRLLTESALTLDHAMEISVSMELAARDAHQLSTVRSSTTTMVIDAKSGDGSSHLSPKKSFMDNFYSTFSSPIAWVLVLALIITWSCVFVIMFDMMDYKTLSGGLTKLGSDPMKAVNDAVEGSSNVLTKILIFAANLIAPDEDEVAAMTAPQT